MRIFISYAHADKAWYDRLSRHIESTIRANADNDCEIFSDRDIAAGEAWDDRIRQEIGDADLVILLGTAAFVSSVYITGVEVPLILAKSNQAALFPILVTSVAAEHAPELQRIQWKPTGTSLAKLLETPVFDDHLLELMNELGRRVRRIKRTSNTSFRSPVSAGGATSFSANSLTNIDTLAAVPFVRISFVGLGRDQFKVEVEARTPPGPFELAQATLQLDARTSAQKYCDAIFQNKNVDRVLAPLQLDAKKRHVPIRIQLVFDRSAHFLDQIAWETLTWNNRPLGMSGDFVFSRQFSFPDADYGELEIKPKDQIRYCRMSLSGEPEEVEPDLRWSSPPALGSAAGHEFPDVWEWPDINATVPRFRSLLRNDEVVYLAWSAAIDVHDATRLYVPWPKAGVLGKAPVEDLCAEITRLGAEQPSLVILSPRTERNTEINRLLGYELAAARVPAVLVPVGEVPAEAWELMLLGLVADLKRHGIIDLAVTSARRLATESGFSLILYLRSRSARLWYEPSFVDMRGDTVDARQVFAALNSAFLSNQGAQGDAADHQTWAPACVALVGSNLDRAMSLSRRDMARDMAKKHGFALSRTDREDLETVAEYVFVSQARSTSPIPHVEEFVKIARDYLIRNFGENDDFSKKSLFQISQIIWSRRDQDPDDVFAMLARLKIGVYLTTYYNRIIENVLEEMHRTPRTLSFVRGCEPADHAHYRAFDEPTVASPLVYHCFGLLEKPESILVSKSDFLDFFATFCQRRENDELTIQIRAMLASSTLLILGFRPNSSELRLLLAIYRNIQGRGLSRRRTHVAVQIDPEDDHTIDPEDARSFYRGLLSEFGDDVYLYWGKPEEFLKALQTNCPELFL
jgi:hypothetical protein